MVSSSKRMIVSRVGSLVLFAIFLLLFSSILMLVIPPHVYAQTASTQNPTMTSTATATPTATPEPEPTGQVGANAGLVCGAGVLVIIIIAGLLWSARWMQLRGDQAEHEKTNRLTIRED